MANLDQHDARRVSRPSGYLVAIVSLAVAAIVIVGGAFALTESERLDLQVDAQTAITLHVQAGQLSDAVRDEEAAVDDYLLASTSGPPSAFDTAVQAETRSTAAMQVAAAEYPAVQAALTAVTAAAATWQATYARPAIAAAQAGGGSALAPFIKGSADDQAAPDAAVITLDAQLAPVDDGIAQRQDALALERLLATIVGLSSMALAAVLGVWLVRRYGRTLQREAQQAGVFNRFTEVSSFAADDTAVAAANLEALMLLVHPDAAVTHVLNRSKDRAVPESITGDALAEVLPLNALWRCPGVARGSMYVTDDAAAPLSVHCPVYPVQHGTLACVPLNSGEAIGAVHLYWERPQALPLEQRASITRVAEHAALAIGNRRLLTALQSQASTDSRTGLANNRAFDAALEEALSVRVRDETLAVLMIDLDHFKDFNDQHGHPGGDEALRAFGGVLRSCMREGDLAARYGGEEFAVLLPGVDGRAAATIAERIRARTESTIIALAPGLTARMTISIGVAAAPAQGLDRITLLHVADEALYRAKAAGRNRVAYLADDAAQLPTAASRNGATAGRDKAAGAAAAQKARPA